MNTKLVRPRRPPLVALALAVAVLVAACGSASSSGAGHTSTTASASSSSRAKLTACLKQHGVTLPTRRGGGRGFFGGGPPGGTPGTGTSGAQGGGPNFGSGHHPGFFGSSKFRTALRDCGVTAGHFPGSGRFRSGHFRPHFSASTLRAFTTCVKQHGYALPKPNTSGKGPIFPSSIESHAKFKRAAAKCSSLLRPSSSPGNGNPSTTSSS